jgi:hypothetical protein
MGAKLYKVLPHLHLDTDISIWMDANIYLRVSKERIVDELLGDADIAIFKHPYRESVLDEAKVLKQFGWEKSEVIEKQMEYYLGRNYPLSTLYECGVIIRRHNHKTELLNNIWWSHICTFSHRDQLSFPIALNLAGEMTGLKVNVIQGNVRNHPLFVFGGHTGACEWK